MTDLAPLYSLRITTSRLELRLGSDGEMRELGRLAERGIHPPDEMPFREAWTDRIGEPTFLDGFEAFHAQHRADWRPDDWSLDLLVWVGGELAGTQSLLAKRFAETSEVSTGSWLGAAFQGRGIGTEMRTAVLELAFTGLGATAAVSEWLDGNVKSQRVSERLGYVPSGESTVSPRGIPVVEHHVRRERGGWRPPVPVLISGLEPALALFGAGQPSERNAAPSD